MANGMGAANVFGMEEKEYIINMRTMATPHKDQDLGGGKSNNMLGRDSSTGRRASGGHQLRSSWETFGVMRDEKPSTPRPAEV